MSLAKKAGLEIGERGGVLTDARLRTSAPDVFAAGDIAEYDCVVHGGERLRIEHWDVAENQGKTAALLDARPRRAPRHRPVLLLRPRPTGRGWSTSGPAYGWTEEIVRGSIEDGEFTVWYLDGDRLAAALAVDRSDDLERARELIKSREPVDREELAEVP